ncbi:FMN-binding protein [Deinococcus ruber]|uniref:FMN-binding domain-containing protein n=1 Tax=Deinococcus ruber TaxID=1848197 RepID=A0A918FIM2_9DEIO|nr:FMN-binding protein [Deinococcus ruber]GGR37676.1 hypothetical protein GCM10008957_53800 [Deinococcus ruber]
MNRSESNKTAVGRVVPLMVTTLWAAGLVTTVTRTSAAAAPSVAQAIPGRVSPYRDGTYTATGQYGNLPSSITVTVTLKGGLITAVRVTPHATDPTSLGLQRRFAAAVPAVVVGKPIADVKVDRLAGSSGTPKGFNAALEQVRKQAGTSH